MHAYNIIELEQRSQEWLKFREGKIGASQAAGVLDIDPYLSRLDLWNELIFKKERASNSQMNRGIEEEPIALRMFNAHLGDSEMKPAVLQSVAHPNIIASLDGMRNIGGSDQIVEIKSVRGKVGTSIPPHHWAQLQQQMFVSGTKHAWYVTFDGYDISILEAEKDEAFVGSLLRSELDFLSSLIDFIPPEPTERDWVKKTIQGEKISRYFFLQDCIKKEEEELEIIKKELISECEKKRTVLISEFEKIKIQKIPRKGAVDYSSIPQLKGVNTELYRKPPTEYWRLDRVSPST